MAFQVGMRTRALSLSVLTEVVVVVVVVAVEVVLHPDRGVHKDVVMRVVVRRPVVVVDRLLAIIVADEEVLGDLVVPVSTCAPVVGG